MFNANAVKQWATSRKAALYALITSMVVAGMSTASATVTDAEAAFTDLEGMVSEFEGYAWSLLAVVLVALIGLKLVKKFANRAS